MIYMKVMSVIVKRHRLVQWRLGMARQLCFQTAPRCDEFREASPTELATYQYSTANSTFQAVGQHYAICRMITVNALVHRLSVQTLPIPLLSLQGPHIQIASFCPISPGNSIADAKIQFLYMHPLTKNRKHTNEDPS